MEFRKRPGTGLRGFLFTSAALLLLWNLGNGRLWQDEAETAVLGRNILLKGYPAAFDGVNQLNPALPVREGTAWTYHPWLSMYIAAASFSLLGATTTAARLPFALFGLASIWLGARLAKRWTLDSWIANLTTLLFTTSVPFLLHMRQCRYYAPAVFFTLWTAWAYLRFLQNRPFSAIELTVALLLLFHTDHGVFLPVALACGIHFVLSRSDRAAWTRATRVVSLLAVLTIPWMVYLKVWQHHRLFSWLEVRHHLEFYVRQTNRYLVPLGFWIVVCLLARPSMKALFGDTGTPVRSAWKLVGWLLGIGFLFLIFVPEQRHFRYLLFLVPFLFMAQASLLAWLFRRGWAVGFWVTVVLVLTDLIPYSGPSLAVAWIPAVKARLDSPHVTIRSLPLEFLGELTHSYRGPVDGIIELLQSRGRSGQVVKTPYEEHPILFYTSLRVETLVKHEEFARETFPDWIILRRDWLPGGFFESPYYAQIRARYRELLLDAPDIPWQNRPDPGYHRFRTDTHAPPVIVFQRKS